ncbi:hypothetical protein Tco_0257272 [Tanacetum coccineum]
MTPCPYPLIMSLVGPAGAASEWFTNECIGTVSIWDDLVEKFIQKFYNLFDHNEKEEAEENDDPDEIENAQIEGSWGDATPGVMKLCTWLRNSFENFYELDYGVLVKLEECWWKIRRFEMTKYSFEADEEYVAIKELEHINHSETNMDAQYAYRELFNKMDDGWLVTRAVEE